jgi:hypothetical protein
MPAPAAPAMPASPASEPAAPASMDMPESGGGEIGNG